MYIEDLTRVLMFFLIYQRRWENALKCEATKHFIAYCILGVKMSRFCRLLSNIINDVIKLLYIGIELLKCGLEAQWHAYTLPDWSKKILDNGKNPQSFKVIL